MKSKIIRSSVSLILAIVSIVRFCNNDVTMGMVYGVLAIVFFVAIFVNRNKQD